MYTIAEMQDLDASQSEQLPDICCPYTAPQVCNSTQNGYSSNANIRTGSCQVGAAKSLIGSVLTLFGLLILAILI